jgi:hypothetical protein
MQFCDSCGTAMVKSSGGWVCRSCNPDAVESTETSSDPRTPAPRPAEVSNLSTTESGSVRKADAMAWLDSLDEPTADELQDAVIPKPNGFTGSTYPTSISNIRITGDPAFIETVAGLLKPLQDLEGTDTRVEINLQQTEDRDSGDLTGNYALYLSVAERG